jgi:hypothetical protein
MNEKPFRIDVFDAGSTIGAGDVLRLNLQPSARRRWTWIYYENANLDTAGDACWVIFYKDGQVVAELPAFVRPTDTTWVGCGTNNIVRGISTFNNNAPAAICWDNGDNNGIYIIHPFQIEVEADEVRMTANKGGSAVRALLAVLSL